MRFARTFTGTLSMVLLASAAMATDGSISPLPDPMPAMDHISASDSDSSGIMSTKPQAKPSEAALPWKSAEPAPPAVTPPGATTTPAPLAPAGPQKMPFGHAEPLAPIIPDGPHATVAVPVVQVDAQAPAEAAAPTPPDPAADPSKEDPANPTELTAPIFGQGGDVTPRKTVLRLLNKVTAQSTVMTIKPNETVKVGTLEITAITCQTSAPTSQTDYAALLDIIERLPTAKDPKPLFRGWMYASSPSVTALEHPVYDVTVVQCEMPPAPKKEEKPAEKPAKKGRK